MHSAPSAPCSPRSRWSFWLSVLLLVAAGGFGSSHDASAATFTVNSTADIGDANQGDGICETALGNGICTLRAAIMENNWAVPGGRIDVPAGLYLGVSALDITRDVEIVGAGADATIIDGYGSFYVFDVQYGAVVIRDLAIRGASGYAITNSANLPGLNLTRVTISDSSVGLGNGQFGQFEISASHVFRNDYGIQSSGFGSVRGCLVEANSRMGITESSGPFGQAVLEIVETTIRDNGDAGIVLYQGALSVSYSAILNNAGGGVASNFAGGFATLSILNTAIADNGGPGVAYSAVPGSGGVWNSTISGNAGGIFVQHSSFYPQVPAFGVYASTVAHNGFGIESTFPVFLERTILFDNGPGADCNDVLSQGHNLIGQPIGCAITGDVVTNVLGANPNLGPLRNNGGLTSTHALLAGSPAIDAAGPCSDADQRGVTRPQGTQCDIGAYEFTCGNGSIDLGEECDDGNLLDGDCCSSVCEFEPLGSPCDDRNACTTMDGCTAGVCVGGEPPTCGPCLTCEPSLGCTLPTNPGCSAAPSGASALLVKNSDNSLRDLLSWRWKSPGPLPLSDVGSPISGGTDYTLCLIDSRGAVPTLIVSASTPDDGLCIDGPCWTADPRGYRYLDRTRSNDGLLKILLRPSSSRGRIDVKGKGGGLDLPTFPLVPPVTVRFLRRDAPQCWEATFSSPSLGSDTVFRARAD